MDKRKSLTGLISRRLKKTLSKKTYAHVLGVAKTAVMLAGRFGADVEKAKIAGLLHDSAKDMSAPELEAAMKEYGVKINGSEKKIPAIWHGPVAAKIAEKEFGIRDTQLLRAIRLHSTGGMRMGKLGKIIYAADFMEPGREYRESRQLRAMLEKNITLDYLVYCVIMEKLRYLRGNKMLIHPATKLLLAQIKKREFTRNT